MDCMKSKGAQSRPQQKPNERRQRHTARIRDAPSIRAYEGLSWLCRGQGRAPEAGECGQRLDAGVRDVVAADKVQVLTTLYLL